MYPFIENMITGKTSGRVGSQEVKSDSQEYIEMQIDAFLRIQTFNKYAIITMFGLEVVFMLLFWLTGDEDFEWIHYLVMFIARPMGLCGAAYFLAKWSLYKVKTLRGAVYSQLMVCAFISMVIIIVHYVFQITLIISIIPLTLSILFTDKKLSWNILYITLITHTLGVIGTFLDGGKAKTSTYPYAIILSYVFLLVFEMLVQILIGYSLKMQAITQSSFNYASLLKKKSEQDSLTQLYNHESFMQILGERVAILKDSPVSLHVAMLDIDKFKNVNDTWGHQFGDVVLRRLSDVLRTYSGNGITVARYGGEEFILLFEGLATDQVEEYMERMKDDFHHSHYREDYVGTFSAGIVKYQSHMSITELVEQADEALYYAKEHGRDRICCYESVRVKENEE